MNSPNLDLLRALAVALVVFAHTMIYIGRSDLDGWTGTTGVCFFFVHTSLVLMWSLQRDPRVSGFYVRRIFRIYPLWLLVLCVTLLLKIPTSPIFAPAFGFHQPGERELLANASLLMNFDRFGPQIVGASWTLPIEVDMYIVLPFLFVFANRYKLLWPLVILDGLMILFAYRTFPAMNGGLGMCVPYFIPGIMAYVLFMRPKLRVLPPWVFLLFLAALAVAGHRWGSYRGSWLLCLSLGVGIPLFQELTWKPLITAAHLVAKYSYGIYLTHIWSICVFVHYTGGLPLAVRLLAFTASLTLLPVIFYHAVEQPMIRFGSHLMHRRVTPQSMALEPAP